MTPNEKSERAKQILEDPIFKAVMKDARERLIGRLEGSEITTQAMEHEVVLTLQCLHKIPALLESYTDFDTVDKAEKRHEAYIERARQTVKKYLS